MSTKRRRTNSDGERAVERRPDVVPTSSSSSGGTESADEPELLVPVLDPIPRLIRELYRQENEEAVITALDELGELLESGKKSEKNRKEATFLGAHFAALATILNYQHNESIQWKACGCLVYSLYGATSSTSVSIAKSGSIEAILNAMKLFPDSTKLQVSGCVAVNNTFTTEHSKRRHAAIMDRFKNRFVHQLGGVELVIRAMEKLPDDIDVQASGCLLFYNLSHQQELRSKMVKDGVVRGVGAALAKHDNEDVEEHGKNCMKNLFAEES